MKNFIFIISAILLFGSCGNGKQQSIAIPERDSIPKGIDGIYYGLTDDTLGVKNPWVFYLNTHDHKGASYSNFDELSQVEIDSTGRVLFRSGDSERWFTFHGTIKSGIIDGQFLQRNKKAPLALQLTPIKLSKNHSDSAYGTLYSSYHYVEEAGDEVGEEVFMLPGTSEPIVIFGMAEGEFEGPFDGINVRRMADTVEFSTANLAYGYAGGQQTEVRSDIHWRAEVSKRRIVLIDIDQNDSTYKFDTLKRTESIEHFLKRIAYRK